MEHQRIIDAIEAAGETVYYGMAQPGDGQPWNYTVFNRLSDARDRTRTSETEHFRIAVVREELIADEDVDKVREAVKSIRGVKDVGEGVSYQYMRQTNGIVTEVAEMRFSIPRKRCE